MTSCSRFSTLGSLVAVLALLVGILASFDAGAHHPGSHAERVGGEDVRLDVAVPVRDGCTTIAGVTLGLPAGTRAPTDAEPVRVQLSRPAGMACTQALGVAHQQAVLTVRETAQRLHLFIVSPTGEVQGTERVAIR